MEGDSSEMRIGSLQTNLNILFKLMKKNFFFPDKIKYDPKLVCRNKIVVIKISPPPKKNQKKNQQTKNIYFARSVSDSIHFIHNYLMKQSKIQVPSQIYKPESVVKCAAGAR